MYSSQRPRGIPYKRHFGGTGRVFRGSPHMRGASAQNRSWPRPAAPQLHVTISNSNAEEVVEAAYADQQRVVELPVNVGGGDYRQSKPPASTAVSQQLAPSVARLFSTVTEKSCATRDDISELLDVHPQGIELSNFCRVFEVCFRRPFDSRWSDVGSLRQMLERMDDLVECVELGNEVIVTKKDAGTGIYYVQGNALHVSAVFC